MIIYISENLNNKKNGGSSTSGYEFLQFLRIKHKSVVVVTLNKLNFKNKSEEFYGNRMSEIHEDVTLKRSYLIKPFTLKKIAKKICGETDIFFEGFGGSVWNVLGRFFGGVGKAFTVALN